MRNFFRGLSGKPHPEYSNGQNVHRISPQREYSLPQNLVENIPIELAIYDTAGRFVFINNKFQPDAELRNLLIGKDDEFHFKMSGIDPAALEKRRLCFQKAVREKTMVGFTEKLSIPATGKTLFYKRYYQPVFASRHGQEVAKVCFLGNNMTTVILSQKELKYLAHHDRLTGLMNRTSFNQHLDEILIDSAREHGRRTHALLFCDLDNFKLVNDTIGHDIGDLVLKETARRLKEHLRKSDYVFRLGGDEFTIILKNLTSEAGAGQVAQKIIQALAQPFEIEGHKITCLSSSIGISLIPKDGSEKQLLIKCADTAMYQAKSRGKNHYEFFNPEMTRRALRRMEIAEKLRELVETKDYDRQLQILYQPIMRQRVNGDFKMVGVEALLRWNNPQLGTLSPDEFIPVAEEAHLMDRIGEWVLYRSCMDTLASIRRTARQFYLSVNLSARQLKNPEMVQKVENILKTTDMDPRHLQFEVTESTLLDDGEMALKNMQALRDLGIRIAIDDFGTGYASLALLQRIPANTLKIDKSYVQSMQTDSEKEGLVKAILLIGQNLYKEVIAEGVETSEQLEILKGQSCSKFQGYIFSRPLNLAQVENMLQSELKTLPPKTSGILIGIK